MFRQEETLNEEYCWAMSIVYDQQPIWQLLICLHNESQEQFQHTA
jgi:hypothetical protein